jgi:hypothetical protein
MKKLLLIILFSILSIAAYSQSRLNYSANEIREEFSDSKYNLKSNFDKNGNYYISILTGSSTVFYYFNAERTCIATFIVPDNQGALNSYVETYNNKYVIVSPTQWKMYSNNGMCEIKLVYSANGGYYFMWNN